MPYFSGSPRTEFSIPLGMNVTFLPNTGSVCPCILCPLPLPVLEKLIWGFLWRLWTYCMRLHYSRPLFHPTLILCAKKCSQNIQFCVNQTPAYAGNTKNSPSDISETNSLLDAVPLLRTARADALSQDWVSSNQFLLWNRKTIVANACSGREATQMWGVRWKRGISAR